MHSFFNGNGTLEFRGYNSTLHAGKVKTAIQLSLAMCHQAKIQRSASRIVTQTDNPKYTFRTYLLRLGLNGDEFKSCRQHLLEPRRAISPGGTRCRPSDSGRECVRPERCSG